MIATMPPRASWPEKAAIALMALPVALFLGTWFRPALGIPAAAVALWTAWRLMRNIEPSELPSRRALAYLAIVAVVWTWTTGSGGYFQQVWDQNFRSALLHDLIESSWPVVWSSSEGTVALDYYLAWSLLPALVGKLAGWHAASLAMAGYTAVGAFLALLLFARVAGAWRWWIPLVFLLWSGMDILGWALRGQFPAKEYFIESWSKPLWFLSHLMSFFCVSHIAVPAWLTTLLVAGRRIGHRGLVGVSAFLIPLAPFPAIGVAPFVAWMCLQGEGSIVDRFRRCLTPENILAPLVFAAICGPYFLANAGLGEESGWFLDFSPHPTATTWIKYGAFWLFEILLPAWAIRTAGQKDDLLLVATGVLCLIPLRRAGMSNDLALKMSIPGLVVLTVFTARAFLSGIQGWRRWLLVGVFTLGAATPLEELWASSHFTYVKLRSSGGDLRLLQQDRIGTFEPGMAATFPEQKFLVNFRSHPLEESPLLRRMLASDR